MYEIITHGGGEVLWNAFNSIALLFQRTGIMGGLLYIAFNLSIIVATTQMVITQDSIRAFKWAFLSLFVMNALLLPKVNVIVIDRAALYDKKVDNVPFILGFTASFTSKMGEFLARKFDEVFSPPGLEYSSSGVAMASKLVSKSAYMTVPNPDVAENYKEFVRNCLMIDLVRGKYTANEFYNTEDTWDFLSKTSSPIRGFPYKNPLGKTEILTCRKFAAKEKDFWKYHIKSAGRYFGFNVLQSAKDPLEALMTHIPISYEYLTGISQDASLTLRQAIMRNLIRDSVVSINANNPEGAETARAIAATRAQEQQKNTYALHGDTASLSLSTLKVLFEVLVYALFPIAATIALFPGGLRIAKEYFIMMFSIQMWAPMYAVLNMVLNVMARHKSMAAVTVIGANGELSRAISYGTLPKLAEANEWIAAVAGYGMGLIPFLAYGLFRYGAGALTQISSHFGSVSQSALGSAADMKTTGGMGIGNTNFDNHSRSNVSAMKHDTNMSVAAGKTTMQGLDGSISHEMPNNNLVHDRRPTVSDLGATFNESMGASAGINKMAETSHRAGVSHTQSSQEHLASSLNEYHNIAENYQKGKNLTNSWAHGESVMKDSAISTLYAASKELSDRLGVDMQASNQILFGGKVSANVGVEGNVGFSGSKGGKGSNGGGIGGGVSGKAGINVGGNATINHDERTLNSEQQGIVENIQKKYDIQNLLKKAENESQEGRYAMVDSNGNQYDSGIRAHLDKAFSHQKMAQASFAKEDAYREAAQFVSTSGVETTQNASQQVLENLIKKEGGLAGAIEKLSTREGMRQTREDFVNKHSPALEQQFTGQKVHQTSNSLEEKYKRNAEKARELNNPESIYDANKKNIVQQANDKKLMEPIQNDIQNKTEDAIKNADQEIQKQQDIFNTKKEKMEKRYEEFSKDNKVPDVSSWLNNLFKGKREGKPTGKLDDD